MLCKVQNLFNINIRLPLVQESITSTKYFVPNSTGNSCIRFTCRLEVTLYTTVYVKRDEAEDASRFK